MKSNYRNIVSLYLLVLIFFSTIGFNIISTICDGCDIEYTSIAITSSDDELACECCQTDSNEVSCCHSENNHKKDHHRSSSIFAKLKIDSPEAKAKVFKAEIPIIFLHLVSMLFHFEINFERTVLFSNINFSPPPSGRTLLNLICILRN